jgi:type II secretory pathway component PulM
MTTRDRLMLMGIVAFAVLLGAWFTTVAPERERASKVTAEVESARQQLSAAESQASSASSAQAQYSTAYTSLVSLGQAVPASAETPALIYMLDRASHSRDVQFSSIASSSSSSSGSSAAPTAAA